MKDRETVDPDATIRERRGVEGDTHGDKEVPVSVSSDVPSGLTAQTLAPAATLDQTGAGSEPADALDHRTPRDLAHALAVHWQALAKQARNNRNVRDARVFERCARDLEALPWP